MDGSETALGPIGQEIHRRVASALAPDLLDVVDESALHAGHSGHNPEGESHFRVIVAAAAFTGMSRVERTRAVQRAVGDLVSRGRVHALSVETRLP